MQRVDFEAIMQMRIMVVFCCFMKKSDLQKKSEKKVKKACFWATPYFEGSEGAFFPRKTPLPPHFIPPGGVPPLGKL